MSALLRPNTCVRAARAVTTTTRTTAVPTTAVARTFSTTPRRLGGDKLEYEPPTGWLFGVKPGEKYQREGWELPFYWLFCGGLAVFSVAYAFKPDTSIQTWALEEARRRLEKEGILEDPFPGNKKQ
ncbi:hypothetical protein GQ53DRAFT_752003 [Thozetella sp. PMI_491]|nr:hypothetical protein GQ53DRAFT_752003 [Thozetella sp. PMI_491]